MQDAMRVEPAVLGASAGVARAVAEDFGAAAAAAVAASRDAAGALAGWPVGTALGGFAEGWNPVLAAVRERFTGTAANLEETARNHAWNERSVTEVWERREAAR